MHSTYIKKLLQNFAGKSKANSVNIVPQRFKQLFREHGVEDAQIPRLLPIIRLDDLKSDEALLAVLTPEILDQTAQLFGIRSQWLEGVDDRIYECLTCYKQPAIFFEDIALLKQSNKDYDGFYVQTLTTTKELNMKDDSQQLMAVILAEKFAELGDKSLYRYHVYGDGWDWGYPSTRIQLKAMARLFYMKFGKAMPLYTAKRADIENIWNGNLFPRNYLGGCLISTPSLEDFALSPDQSRIAKEVDELPYVLKYIEEYHLESPIVIEPPQSTTPDIRPNLSENLPEQAGSENKAPESGKRAQNTKELWEPVRTIVRAWWAEEGDALHIAEAIRRIKNMPHLKAAALCDSAIRRHIVKFAPENVRGKSGRKSKKPS